MTAPRVIDWEALRSDNPGRKRTQAALAVALEAKQRRFNIGELLSELYAVTVPCVHTFSRTNCADCTLSHLIASCEALFEFKVVCKR